MSAINFEDRKHSFRSFYNNNTSTLQGAENIFKETIFSILKFNEKINTPEILSRVKSCEEAISKFQLKYLSNLEQGQVDYQIKDHITDLIGIRVICLYEVEIKIIKEILSDEFQVLNVTDKSSIVESSDDTFGYKGLHLDLKLNPSRADLVENIVYKDYQFEVQIRTNIQDSWSALDHAIKYKKNIPLDLKRRINRLAALFEIADQEFGDLKKITDDIKSKEEISQLTIEENLDAFNCLVIINSEFPEFKFFPDHVDNFVSEIQTLCDKAKGKPLTAVEFLRSLSENKAKIIEYGNFLDQNSDHKMNPYTQIRHSLYLTDSGSFNLLLFNLQRENFQGWIEKMDRTR